MGWLIARGTARQRSAERQVLQIWGSAFRRAGIDRDDDFFALGGDSLTGLVILGELEASFGVALGLDAFATARTPAAIAAIVGHRRPPGVRRREPSRGRLPADYPLSLAQEPIWRYCQLPQARGQYGKTAEWDVEGRVDPALLRAALARVVEREPSLRTVFVEGPLQRVLATVELPLIVIDAVGAQDPEAIATQAAHAAANREYDLERGPLGALTLVRMEPKRSFLVLAAHNLICDLVSSEILWRELCEEYAAVESGGTSPRPRANGAGDYGELAERQRSSLHELSGELKFWRELLEDAPPRLELPFARARPNPHARVEDSLIERVLTAPLTDQIDGLAKRAGVTRYVLHLGAFAAQLAADGGCRDLVLGAYLPGRPTGRHDTIGLFMHLGVIRLRVDLRRTLSEWLGDVRGAVAPVAATLLPYELVLAELTVAGSRAPEVTAIFDAHRPRPEPDLGGHRSVRRVAPRRVETMPWGFHMLADSREDALLLRAQHDARIHDPVLVGSFLDRLERFLTRACERPERTLAELCGDG